MNYQPNLKSSPQVSVVMPTYNQACFIKNAVESVLEQTYQNFELIIIDDGSTDETAEILKSYQHDGRVRCFFESHTDRCTTKNIGIENARGQYIAFLDSDDIWLPRKLEEQVNFLDQNPGIALVHGFVEMMDLQGHFISEETVKLRKLCQQAQKRGEDYTGLMIGAVLFTSALMIRKECLDQIGYFDPNAAFREDLDLCLRFTKKNYHIGFLGWNAITRYRYRGAEGHTEPAVLRAYLNIFQKNREFLEKENLLGKYRTAYWHSLIYSADCYYLLDELEEFRRVALRVIRFDLKSLFNLRLMRHFFISFFPFRRFKMFHLAKKPV